MWNGREGPGKSRWWKTTPGAEVCEVKIHSRMWLEEVKTHQMAENSQLGEGGVFPPREVRELYRSQSPWTLETNSQAGERPELRVEERILVGDQLNSAELQPLVCLIEARGKGLLRSAREGGELRTGTNMRALMSTLAGGRAEIEKIGHREGWPMGIKEEMMDRLQSMVRVALQKGGDLIMSSIPYSWRE